MSMSQRPTLVGQQVDEYYLEAMLGEGGMASVYRAVDVRLNRYVAIKVIQTTFRNDSTYIKRFEREAQAIAQLQHPNIITLYRFGESEGLLYLAMQYIEGADLAAVIESFREDNAYIDYAEVIRLAHEIGGALDYAHSRGVIHRDIKPHNIMISADNHAIVTDFGLALLTELGTHGEIFGSPHYIAPEQAISSASVVPQSDLYAFAVVLYQMLTNALPFDAESPLDIAMMHMSDPAPSPRNFRPELPQSVADVLLKALSKEPEDRYASGQALAHALEVALLGKPQPALPPTSKPVTIAERVALERDANPLPPLPTPTAAHARAEQAAAEQALSVAPTTPNERASTEPNAGPRLRISRESLPFIIAAGIIALLFLVLLLGVLSLAGGNQDNAQVAENLSLTPAVETLAVTTESTPDVGTPVVIGVPTLTDFPLLTSTPDIPTPPPPTTAGDTVPQTVPRLLARGQGLTTGQPVTNGQFEVEGYCTRLNAIYQTEEDGVNWYCTQNNQRVVTLSQDDFNEICRLTYGNPNAYAIQAVGSQPAAYSWLCFEDTAAAGSVPQQPAATGTSQQVAAAGSYILKISWRGEDSLFVTNTSLDPFPLTGLLLSGQGQINGTEWGIQSLASGECVAIWNDSGSPQAADQTCTQVGSRVVRDSANRFWKSPFAVIYNSEDMGLCEVTPCLVTIQP